MLCKKKSENVPDLAPLSLSISDARGHMLMLAPTSQLSSLPTDSDDALSRRSVRTSPLSAPSPAAPMAKTAQAARSRSALILRELPLPRAAAV